MREVLEAVLAALPGAGVELAENPSPCAQHALVVAGLDALAVAFFLRGRLGYDYCSNVTGVDWPPRKIKETVVTKEVSEGVEKEVKSVVERELPGYLEVVYHLYSIRNKSGPLTLRQRTRGREAGVGVQSLTPVWKSAEFQEREVFDLFGILFVGHPDLRRILMWDEFADHPMRKDYVAPDDCEYEPTPHDEILDRVKSRRGAA